MTVKLYQNDIPDNLKIGDSVAIDTETMGLQHGRDRLCLVQFSFGDGVAHLVQFAPGQYEAPRLKKMLEDPSIQKLFHFARFDLATIEAYLGVSCRNVYCTRTASKLVRTYTDKHGLKELCKEILGFDLNKQQQSSDWGAESLTTEQMNYAAGDVLYLHKLKGHLDKMLEREGRMALFEAACAFLPHRAALDLAGWADQDIFAH